MIATTSTDVDWRLAVGALTAAAADDLVALVVLGTAEPPAARPAGLLHLADAGRIGLERARDLITATVRAYDLVLVAGDAGLLEAVGRDGWTLVDLAVALGAPALVVTGPGPDAANHTALALDALAGRGIPARVVTVGEVELPVEPVGRIPADPPADFAGAAGWFDHEPQVTAVPPAPAPVQSPGRPPVDGRRFVLGLLGVFVVMVLLACGMGWCSTGRTEHRLGFVTDLTVPDRASSKPVSSRPAASRPAPLPTRRPVSTDVCPERAGQVAVGRPDAATTARVGKAWQRIEKWLAAEAPASAASLRPPAGPAAIDEMQRRMSVAFPGDLVASLRRHDGVTAEGRFTLPPFFEPSRLGDIHSDWEVNCGVLAGTGGSWPEPWWHRHFVPFAAAGDGGSLLVDQRPGGHGRVGEFYPEDGTGFDDWPASVAELLEMTAGALETGRPYAGRYRPRVDGAVLDWEIV